MSEPKMLPDERKLWVAVKNRDDKGVRDIIQTMLQEIIRDEEPYDRLYSWGRRLNIKLDDGAHVSS